MNSTPNNTNPLTPEEISNLHGEDLKKVLAQRLGGYKDKVKEIDESLKDICEDVEKMPEVDEVKTKKEDDAALAEIEGQLDTDLNDAMLDFATEDEILKDVNEEEGDNSIE
jgi:hypothetical protein